MIYCQDPCRVNYHLAPIWCAEKALKLCRVVTVRETTLLQCRVSGVSSNINSFCSDKILEALDRKMKKFFFAPLACCAKFEFSRHKVILGA
jgi:hypothetical protein